MKQMMMMIAAVALAGLFAVQPANAQNVNVRVQSGNRQGISIHVNVNSRDRCRQNTGNWRDYDNCRNNDWRTYDNRRHNDDYRDYGNYRRDDNCRRNNDWQDYGNYGQNDNWRYNNNNSNWRHDSNCGCSQCRDRRSCNDNYNRPPIQIRITENVWSSRCHQMVSTRTWVYAYWDARARDYYYYDTNGRKHWYGSR